MSVGIADLNGGDTLASTDLTPIAGLGAPPGDDGLQIELRVSAGYIQWRYVGLTWANLVALLDITGDDGNPGADGKTVRSGTGAPNNGLGFDGDFYINTAAWTIYGPKVGGAWASATTLVGPTGANGKTVRNGTGAPAAGLGFDGDFYIDTTAFAIYGPKTAGAWGSGRALTGPMGPGGNAIRNGSGAPSNALGVDGDFYLDTANTKLYGPKAGGAWPGTGLSLVGPIGPGGATSTPRRAKTSTYQIAATDLGALIDASGTFPITFDSASSLGPTFSCFVKNSGLGVITLDPNGAETIDGRTTIRMYPGEGFTVQCDGTSLRTVGRQKRVTISDVTLASAVAAIDVEAFAGDTEIGGLEIEFSPITVSCQLQFKKAGVYQAGATYAYQGVSGANTSTSALSATNNTSFAAGNQIMGRIAGVLSASASGARLIATHFSGGTNITHFGLTETTAGLLEGLRLNASSGTLGIGTVYRVWGVR